MAIVTVSSKGQVVIPAELRTRLGIGPGSQLEVEEEEGTLRVRVRRSLAPSKVDDGFGMLVYRGPPRRLADFDVADAMRNESP